MSRIQNIYDNLSIQAKVALGAGMLFFISAVMSTKSVNGAAITGIVIVLLSAVISAYAVDCYSKGQCEILAWVAASALFVNAMITLVFGKR